MYGDDFDDGATRSSTRPPVALPAAGWIDVSTLHHPSEATHTLAVRRALQLAALRERGAVIWFPAGEYRISRIIVGSPFVTFRGECGTVLRAMSRDEDVFYLRETAGGACFDSLHIRGPQAGDRSAGVPFEYAAIVCYAPDLRVVDCTLADKTTGVYLVGSPHALGDIEVRKCRIQGVANGIYHDPSSPRELPPHPDDLRDPLLPRLGRFSGELAWPGQSAPEFTFGTAVQGGANSPVGGAAAGGSAPGPANPPDPADPADPIRPEPAPFPRVPLDDLLARVAAFTCLGNEIHCSRGAAGASFGLRTDGLKNIRVMGNDIFGAGIAALFEGVDADAETSAVIFAENRCSSGVRGARIVADNAFSPALAPAHLLNRRPIVEDGFVDVITTPPEGYCVGNGNTIDLFTQQAMGTRADVRGVRVLPNAGAQLTGNQFRDLGGQGAALWIEPEGEAGLGVSFGANSVEGGYMGVYAPRGSARRHAVLVADSRFVALRFHGVEVNTADTVHVTGSAFREVLSQPGDVAHDVRAPITTTDCASVRVGECHVDVAGAPVPFAVRGQRCGAVSVAHCQLAGAARPLDTAKETARTDLAFLRTISPGVEGPRVPRIVVPEDAENASDAVHETGNMRNGVSQELPIIQAGDDVGD